MAADAFAIEIEVEGTRERVVVDVGCGEAEVQQRARRHRHALERFVLRGHARRQAVRGRAQTQRLLDEVAQLGAVGAQLLEEPRVLTEELGLLLKRVLGGLQAAKNHGVDDAGDLDVRQRAPERFVPHGAEEADHVVLGGHALGLDVVVDVLLEALQAPVHLRRLLGRQLVLQAGAVDEGRDHRIAPLGELWDVLLWETEDLGHHPLRERAGESRDELDVLVVGPLVDQLVRVARDHLGVPQRPDAHPRIRQLASVLEVQLLRGPERHHRGLHQVVRRREGFLRSQALIRELAHTRGGENAEPHGILDHRHDVLVLGQHERIGTGADAAALHPEHGLLAMEDLVRLVPVLLRTAPEEVDIFQSRRAGHRAQLVVDVLHAG